MTVGANYYENAEAESFFSHFKVKLVGDLVLSPSYIGHLNYSLAGFYFNSRRNYMRILILMFLMLVTGCEGAGKSFKYTSSQCGDKDFERKARNFEHETSDEIHAMSPEEKMDQMLLEYLFHQPWERVNDANYDLLHKLLIEDSIRILPKAIEYVTSYKPTNGSCKEFNEARLIVAAEYVKAVDDREFRVRAITQGKTFLKELEATIELKQKQNHNKNRIRLLSMLLEQMKGTNIADGDLQATFKNKYSIEISHEELNMFIEYLISVDPAYPSWSDVDRSSPPHTFKDPEKFYEAYEQFKTKVAISGYCANPSGIDEFNKVDKIAAYKQKGGDEDFDRAKDIFYSFSDEIQVNIFLIGRLCHDGKFFGVSVIKPDRFAGIGEELLISRGKDILGAISAKIEHTQFWNVLNVLSELLVDIDANCKCVSNNPNLSNALKKATENPPKLLNRFDRGNYDQFRLNILKLNLDRNQNK
ncbi:MAG: hypothetical protein R2681_09050 [Pyrinomonadaceae bacterium]